MWLSYAEKLRKHDCHERFTAYYTCTTQFGKASELTVGMRKGPRDISTRKRGERGSGWCYCAQLNSQAPIHGPGLLLSLHRYIRTSDTRITLMITSV